MRKWLWSLWFILFLFFLINTMPKCIGCKKDFKSQGFLAHKRSCKPYKREIKARLTNVPDLGLVPGPSNESMILEGDGELGTAGDMLVDELNVQVCNGQLNQQKNLILLLNRNQREYPRLLRNTESLVFLVAKQSFQNGSRMSYHHAPL